jgi:hypothetical protein
MTQNHIRIDSVPEPLQDIVLEAKGDLVARLGAEPETVAVTRLERIERPAIDKGATAYESLERRRPDHRIFLLVKGTQYVYETNRGRSPTLIDDKFVL